MNESDLDSEATKETSETSDLDDLEVSSKKTSKQDREISDVNIDSDHKNTQCPATEPKKGKGKVRRIYAGGMH